MICKSLHTEASRLPFGYSTDHRSSAGHAFDWRHTASQLCTVHIMACGRVFRLTAEMLQALFSLFAFAVVGSHALAILATVEVAPDPKCIDITHCRTIWNIIWSSLATIFACAWVSVHRKIPDPQSDGITVTLERVKITIWALLVPEYIIAWAIRQWIAAHQISKEFENLSRPRPRVDSGIFMGSPMHAMRSLGTEEKPMEVTVPYGAFRKRFPKRERMFASYSAGSLTHNVSRVDGHSWILCPNGRFLLF